MYHSIFTVSSRREVRASATTLNDPYVPCAPLTPLGIVHLWDPYAVAALGLSVSMHFVTLHTRTVCSFL